MTVCLNHITKRFADTEAIRDLSITFPEDAIVAIMGPSGCGKTTILKLLAGLLSPDEGELVCDASQISYVFQEPRLLPWRTVADNIHLAHHKKQKPPTRSVQEWLQELGIGDCADRYPEELSGGMRQRVSIARALYCDSDLLLLDEPFQGLDEENRQKIMTLIRQARSAPDKLTIFITHDKAEAAYLADTIVTFDAAPASGYQVQSISH